MSSAGRVSTPEHARRRARRKVWIGLALLALTVMLVAVAAFVVDGDAGRPGAVPGGTDEGGSDLAVLVPLIGALASLIGAVATLLTAVATLWKLRQVQPQQTPPQ